MKHFPLNYYGPILLGGLLLVTGETVQADDLVSVYQLALDADPQYQAAVEAQARYDIAVSDAINAERLLDDTSEALRELTGELPMAPEMLKAEIPLLAPDPVDQDAWTAAAVAQNPLVLAARAATAVAKQEIQVQNSGHYPTVDMVADYRYRGIISGISKVEALQHGVITPVPAMITCWTPCV